ncbi:hypothetical protein DICVIV_13248 [Dictyocaulus viviparus]|uniref:Uncharacterized protein n=1 Tax=Dictyocaulus viviparus TaxID=29172 RepID=A0A0D8XAX8_DICVI|nr:hypothetical protein DICVIV_13248 [Dictyocaulus viviparus]
MRLRNGTVQNERPNGKERKPHNESSSTNSDDVIVTTTILNVNNSVSINRQGNRADQLDEFQILILNSWHLLYFINRASQQNPPAFTDAQRRSALH